MRIAYNPSTEPLASAPLNNDITIDLAGKTIYARGVKVGGASYGVFLKHTSASGGGYDGLVPAPPYVTTTTTRYLTDTGEWKTLNFVDTYNKTEIDDLISGAKTYTDTKIANLVNGAPETLDTLKEISDYLQDSTVVGGLLDLFKKYLPLSGGTVTGVLTLSSGSDKKLILDNTDNDSKYQYISFCQNGTEYGELGTSYDDNLLWNQNYILHSKNYFNYALPLSGGELKAEGFPLILTRTDLDKNTFIRFKNSNNATIGFLGISNINTPAYMPAEGNVIYTLIHSGNIGSQSVASASSASTLIVPYYGNRHCQYGKIGTLKISQGGYTAAIEVISGEGYNAIEEQSREFKIIFRTSNGSPNESGHYFAAHVESGRYKMPNLKVYVVQKSSTEFEIWIKWATYSGASTIINPIITNHNTAFERSNVYQDSVPADAIELNVYNTAYLDSTVAAANKLSAARTIWGQSFDGSGNVSGDLSGVGSITRSFLYAVDSDIAGNLKFKRDDSTWSIISSSGSYYLTVTASSGSVGIGTTSPEALLHVAGNIIANGDILVKGQISGSNNAWRIVKSGDTLYVQAKDVNGGNNGSIALCGHNATKASRITLYSDDIYLQGSARIDGNFYLKNGGYITAYDASDAAVHLIRLSPANVFAIGYNVAQKGYNTSISGNYLILNSGGTPTERMRITADGNVGIGTTNPNTKLHVVGGALFTDTLTINADKENPALKIFNTNGGFHLYSGFTENEPFRIDACNDKGVYTNNIITAKQDSETKQVDVNFYGNVFSKNIYRVTEKEITLKLTLTWLDTGIQFNDSSLFPSSGTYVVQVYINAGSTEGFWYSYFSGIMAVYTDYTNADVPDDEIILHHSSHANKHHIYLKTKPTLGGNETYNKLYIACNKDFTAARNIQFKFKKLI